MEKILIISLFTIGYCCTFWPGMIFEKIGDMMEATMPEWLNKPLWQCYICACFWWGTWVWAILWYDHALPWYELLKQWFFTVIPAMGLNAVVSEFTNKNNETETHD